MFAKQRKNTHLIHNQLRDITTDSSEQTLWVCAQTFESDKVLSLAVLQLSFLNLNEHGNSITEVCLGLEAITCAPHPL